MPLLSACSRVSRPLQVGDPREETTQIGPLARQRSPRTTWPGQVDETKAAGARCLLGGTVPDGPGFFYPVTLLADVTNDMVACKEETFGPVAVVLKAAHRRRGPCDRQRHALRVGRIGLDRCETG